MSVLNPILPTAGDPRGGEEIDTLNALAAILADYNGQINNDNLAAGANIAWSKLANGALVASQLQFKATSGSITAKDRKLWVKAEAY
jgi:hypothetical protein